MLFEILMSFLPYGVVTAYTPGPNNILALNTTSNYGWKQGGAMLFGIGAGFLSVMVLCAVGCFQISKYLDGVVGIMKYIGAAYILWLAVHIALSKPSKNEEVSTAGFWKGFALQFLNVKIILFAITVYTGYVIPSDNSLMTLLIAACFISVIGISGTLVWAAAGSLLQKFLNKYYRPFNIIMALILAENAVKLILT